MSAYSTCLAEFQACTTSLKVSTCSGHCCPECSTTHPMYYFLKRFALSVQSFWAIKSWCTIRSILHFPFSILYIHCLICWPNLKGVDSYLQTYPQLHGSTFLAFSVMVLALTVSFQYWVCPLDGSSCCVFFCLGDLFYYLHGEERRNPNAAGFWRNYQVLYLTWEKPTEGRI